MHPFPTKKDKQEQKNKAPSGPLQTIGTVDSGANGMVKIQVRSRNVPKKMASALRNSNSNVTANKMPDTTMRETNSRNNDLKLKRHSSVPVQRPSPDSSFRNTTNLQHQRSLDASVALNFWRQLDGTATPTNDKVVATINNSSITSEQQKQPLRQQIPPTFDKQNLSIREADKIKRDDISKAPSTHSSIFEAFEIAPLRQMNDAHQHISLNDFGVHHSYVKRGGIINPKKRVAFPETVMLNRQRERSMKASPIPPPPPPPPPPPLSTMPRSLMKSKLHMGWKRKKKDIKKERQFCNGISNLQQHQHQQQQQQNMKQQQHTPWVAKMDDNGNIEFTKRERP